MYQWGSLVDERQFSEMSDIDIALEGITDPATLSALRGAAEKLTQFPLDIVAIEHVHPAYADHIRRRGRVVYEQGCGPAGQDAPREKGDSSARAL
jgi:predicted nucleotidyltransferase